MIAILKSEYFIYLFTLYMSFSIRKKNIKAKTKYIYSEAMIIADGVKKKNCDYFL